jgi:hypothetical protein
MSNAINPANTAVTGRSIPLAHPLQYHTASNGSRPLPDIFRTMEKTKMKYLRSLIAIGAFALVFMALPSIASAQWGRNDDYGRYNNIRGTIMSLQNRARSLDRQVNQIDNRRDRRNDRYDRFDSLDRLATQFKNAVENLVDEYGRGRNINSSRDEAQRVLSLGSQMDSIIDSSRRGRNTNIAYVQTEWNQIERDLNTIARAYGLRYQNRSGGLRDRLPF